MFASLLAFAAAAAPVEPADLSGIWEGSIGNLPVRACFVSREWTTFGAYYYLSHRRIIPLELEEDGDSFLEGSGLDSRRPRWTILSADGAGLAARWMGRGRTLPVRLSRVARADGDEAPCGSLAFHQPRLEGLRIVETPASIDGVSYSRLTLHHGGRFEANVETFALAGSEESVRRVNDTLRQPLSGERPEWLDCLLTALEHGPQGGDFQQRLAPALISTRWMAVVVQHDHYCGGNHPNSGQAYRTFDLSTGQEVDLHDWLTEAAATRERPEWSEVDIRRLQPAFRDVILSGARADAECDEVVRSAEFWNIGLARDGLIFSPNLPHVVQACGDEFTVSFSRLRPFLTAEGDQYVRALQADRVAAPGPAAP